MRVPIACTLNADDATDRVEEWRIALRSSVAATARPAPHRLELRIAEEPGAVAMLVDLARREKACCGFFTFTVEIDAHRAALVIEAPEDAIPVLDGLAALAPPFGLSGH